MAKVKVGFKNPSREQVADKIDTVKTAMTWNANITTPNPSHTTLGTLIDDETLKLYWHRLVDSVDVQGSGAGEGLAQAA